MKTIHIIYPCRDVKTSPGIIGWKLKKYFSKKYFVKTYNWDSFVRIKPKEGDVLIGHPNPLPFTAFYNAIKQPGWSRKILLSPFTPNEDHNGYIEYFIDDVDHVCVFSGEAWFESEWPKKMKKWKDNFHRIDYPIDIYDFPLVCKLPRFDNKEKIKLIYIGSDHEGKGLAFLDEVASLLPQYEIDWYGSGKTKTKYVRNKGRIDLSTESGRCLLLEYDFVISLGLFDANPATIVESMTFGLPPITSLGTGYRQIPNFLNVENSKAEETSKSIINIIDKMNNKLYLDVQKNNHKLILDRYNWNALFTKLDELIESESSIKYSEIKNSDKKQRLWNYNYAYPYYRFLISAVKQTLKRVLKND